MDVQSLRRRSSTRSRVRLAIRTALAMVATFALVAAPAWATAYTVGTTSDTAPNTPCSSFPNGCSLRQLIEYENSTAPTTPDTIVVPAGTYDLTGGAIPITASVTIAGAGARTSVVSQVSSSPDRVFDVQVPSSNVAPAVTISGLEITGGTANASNGCFGGDVRSAGTLTLSEDWITSGTACSGGGIGNDGGTMTVTHSLVTGNAANIGGSDSGGIQNYGPNPTNGNAGSLSVDNSTIAGNTASLGGGIYSWGDASNTTSVTNSTIAYNDGGTRTDQPNAGGLLSNLGGPISVESSIVSTAPTPTPMPARMPPAWRSRTPAERTRRAPAPRRSRRRARQR